MFIIDFNDFVINKLNKNNLYFMMILKMFIYSFIYKSLKIVINISYFINCVILKYVIICANNIFIKTIISTEEKLLLFKIILFVILFILVI
jgi:hypothetical protein